MIELKGKVTQAVIFCDEVEPSALNQIYVFLDSPAFKDAQVRIMPDVHTGMGAVVGMTATMTDKAIPNVIGVDIGCGVASYCLGEIRGLNFEHLDKYIRQNVPFGQKTRAKAMDEVSEMDEPRLSKVAKRTEQKIDYVLKSIGTLGGGNHFIEIEIDDQKNYWLTIHTGSRNFGLKIAGHFQRLAKQETKGVAGVANGLEFLMGEPREMYHEAMRVAQDFASFNREMIAKTIVNGFFRENWRKLEKVESVHNYINFEDKVIRKGAISAHRGERVIIPWNMRDGVILGEGKGCGNWNQSAPHGAGRVLGRSAARETLKMEDFKTAMEGIWSSCIHADTIDESPMAYKNPAVVAEAIVETVQIEKTLKPVYNFKASE